MIRRRRWLWAAGGVAAGLVVIVGLTLWLTRGGAQPVTIEQAKRRLPPGLPVAPGGGRPAPGVYAYRGSGSERLSLPPLSQAEGPTIPGTVQLLADGCWTFRIDYSTNHWQTWTYCRRAAISKSEAVRPGSVG